MALQIALLKESDGPLRHGKCFKLGPFDHFKKKIFKNFRTVYKMLDLNDHLIKKAEYDSISNIWSLMNPKLAGMFHRSANLIQYRT